MTKKTLLITIGAIALVVFSMATFFLVTKGNNSTNGNSVKCIITILGEQYDVTKLQRSHSGGNVFECGTDMTSVYEGEHGTDLWRIQPYKVS